MKRSFPSSNLKAPVPSGEGNAWLAAAFTRSAAARVKFFTKLTQRFTRSTEFFTESTHLFARSTDLFTESAKRFTRLMKFFTRFTEFFTESTHLFARFTKFFTGLTKFFTELTRSHPRKTAEKSLFGALFHRSPRPSGQRDQAGMVSCIPAGTFRAFSLVEILVVVSLLSLIVLALMAVFNSTQRAFRSSVTQTDVLEGGRSAMDLMVQDLRGLAPSGGVSNVPPSNLYPVNFFVVANSTYYQPLPQSLPGSAIARTNLLNYFFILGRENTKWTGTGYIVDTSSSTQLYPLYRFYAETNIANPPGTLYALFANEIYYAQFTNMSHLVDGVVHLNVRAFDPQGRWIQQVQFPFYTNAANVFYAFPPNYPNAYGEQQLFMFSNTVPASVELELGILEDQTVARAESLGVAGHPPSPSDPFVARQWSYLTNSAGTLHLFQQRVTIPNFDASAYQ